MSAPAPARRPVLEHRLADGSVVVADAACAEIRDGEGRVVARYRDGVLELSAAGDLHLSSGGEVVVRGERGVRIETDAQVEVFAGGLTAHARTARLVTSVATTLAGTVQTTAVRAVARVERWELEAERLVESTRDAFREVTGLAQHRVGRLRLLVDDVYSLASRRTEMVSAEDPSIDGRRVLLG